MRVIRLLICLPVFLIVACGNNATATQTPVLPFISPTSTVQPVSTQTITSNPMIPQAISCEEWQSWPVIPVVSETVREVYQRGQLSGNDPGAFSKIGDGEISTEWFFTAFDLGETYYELGPYQDLRLVIDQFRGSFGRIGMAARRGFNTHKILVPGMSDPAACAFASRTCWTC